MDHMDHMHITRYPHMHITQYHHVHDYDGYISICIICISHDIIICMTRWIFDMNYSMDIKYEFLDDMMTVGCHDM